MKAKYCDECEAEDALYEDGVTAGKKAAKEVLFDIETTRFLTDVLTAAGLLYHGKTDKALAQRISDGQARLRVQARSRQEDIALVAAG